MDATAVSRADPAILLTLPTYLPIYPLPPLSAVVVCMGRSAISMMVSGSHCFGTGRFGIPRSDVGRNSAGGKDLDDDIAHGLVA